MGTENGPAIFCAPTEPVKLREMGKVDLVTERNGVDFLWIGNGGLKWGVQRKEIGDLVSSRNDDRLSKELAQMSGLDVAILLVEGRIRWTSEDELLSDWSSMTRRGFHSMLWSCRMRGVWVERTESVDQTKDVIRWLVEWSRKEKHSGMRGRTNPQGDWGRASDKEWAIHLLTSIEGIGPLQAELIYEHFGGVPMAWTVDKEGLMEVKGIGEKRARVMMKALERSGG